MQKVTPEEIKVEDIKKFDVFVFGSNLRGAHGAGAAAFAYRNGLTAGGKGTGMYLRQREMVGSYAIPTKGMSIEVLPLSWVKYFIDEFIKEVNDDELGLNFVVTKVGCGLAGFKVPEIAPLFKPLLGKDNVSLPQDFLDFYEGKYKIDINDSDIKDQLSIHF
jgi:hypothetical protein